MVYRARLSKNMGFLFPVTVVRDHHQFSGFKQHELVTVFGGQKSKTRLSRWRQGCTPSEDSRRESIPLAFSAFRGCRHFLVHGSSFTFRKYHPNLCIYIQKLLFPVCVCLCVKISQIPLFIRTLIIITKGIMYSTINLVLINYIHNKSIFR